MRLFVAAVPPADVRQDLAEMAGRLSLAAPAPPGRSLRVTPPDRWHITLAFIGELPEDRVPRAERAIADAAAAADTPCTVRLSGGGRFGRGRFTTVWVGLSGETTDLLTLGGVLRARLRAARIPFDRKPLRPHLTLARPGDRLAPESLEQDLQTLAAYQGPEWSIDRLSLFSSQIGPHPIHEEIGCWRLSRADMP